MPLRTGLFFATALLYGTPACAEAALADLFVLMPQILLVGLYQELARPWVLPTLWGAAALCWLAYFFSGRDTVGLWMDRFDGPGGGPSRFSSYGVMTFWAALCTLYVVAGSVWLGPPPPAKPASARASTAAAPAPPTLPYPHGSGPENPRGEWPTASGPLPGVKMAAYGGNAYLMLRNPGPAGLWVRLCAAELAPQCIARREVYIAPEHHYLMERVAEGRYHLAYAQVTGARRSGTTPPFSVDPKTWDGMREMVLAEFQEPAPAARP